jgi:hypothetical protein
MRIRFAFVAAALFIATSTLWLQQPAKHIVDLTAGQAAEVPVSAPMWMMSASCDEQGGVYTQPFLRDKIGRQGFYEAPIQRIAPGAESTRIFRFEGAISEIAEGRTFSVYDDTVYVLVSAKNAVYVVQFAKNGTVKTQTQLAIDFPLVPSHLAVFDSGEYLVVGLTGTTGDTTPHLRAPFTAVFATDGHLVKKIYEPEDEDAQQRAEGRDPRYLRCCSESGNEFVGLDADVAAASDGNVYLLHGTSPLLIYVISPQGEVVRKLRIELGSQELTANSIRVYAGHLAIGFNWIDDTPQTLVKVFDLNGKWVADYEIHEGANDSDPILACYNAKGFTMLPRLADKNLRLLTAKLP